MTTEYSFKSSVNTLFDTHKDAYITPIAEVVTRSVESLKENLRHSDNWSVGNSDTDGTYFPSWNASQQHSSVVFILTVPLFSVFTSTKSLST